MDELQTATMIVTVNNKSTTTEPPPQNGQQLKPPGGELKCILMVPNLRALDSVVLEVQEMFSSHGSPLTTAMYHYGKTLLSHS